jgi:hypothetical protein
MSLDFPVSFWDSEFLVPGSGSGFRVRVPGSTFPVPGYQLSAPDTLSRPLIFFKAVSQDQLQHHRQSILSPYPPIALFPYSLIPLFPYAPPPGR